MTHLVSANISENDLYSRGNSPHQIIDSNSVGFVQILTMIQSILLRVVLPLVVIGTGLYIAYELFTADGDESKLTKAWKSIAYSATALIAIALSYAFISIVASISI